MKIAFATTGSQHTSTIQGRILPLARELQQSHRVHVLWLDESRNVDGILLHRVGYEPFRRTAEGKRRLKGFLLIANMVQTAVKTWICLHRLRPDRVVIVKTLPHNVLGVWLWRMSGGRGRIVLDVDDFELAANALSGTMQRGAIHWAERVAVRLSSRIAVATPFLDDHFSTLAQDDSVTKLIVTGLTAPSLASALPQPSTPFTVTYFGSLSVASGHRVDMLPEIFKLVSKKVPDSRLIIAGAGDDEQKLRTLFDQDQQGRISWFGRFDSSDLKPLLSKTTVIIDPVDSSVVNRAKSSYRIALALVSGRAVVTSPVGVRTQLLPRQLHQRLIAQTGSSQEYADRIVELAANPLNSEERMLLQQRSEKYTWKKLCQSYLQLLAV